MGENLIKFGDRLVGKGEFPSGEFYECAHIYIGIYIGL